MTKQEGVEMLLDQGVKISCLFTIKKVILRFHSKKELHSINVLKHHPRLAYSLPCLLKFHYNEMVSFNRLI